jgi:hypothetical protein
MHPVKLREFLSQMIQVEYVRVCFSVKFFFSQVNLQLHYYIDTYRKFNGASITNKKKVKIIVLNDFEVLFQHSSGRFQVK